jgi:hypothetical protein
MIDLYGLAGKKAPSPVMGSKSKHDLPSDWTPANLYDVGGINHAVILGQWRAPDRRILYGIWCRGAYIIDMKNYQNPNAETLAGLLEKEYCPGELGLLTLCSHGVNAAGITLSHNNDLTSDTAPAILKRIAVRLSPDAVVIIDSCFAGTEALEGKCQQLANALQAKVIATAERSFLPSNINWADGLLPRSGKAQWKVFCPT